MPNKSALGLDENIAALLCYLNICLPIGLVVSILVLVQDKNNKLPRFHAFQSLFLTVLFIILWIAYIVVGIIAGIIDGILANTIGFPIFTFLFFGVLGLIGLGLLIMVIIAAVKAFQGQIYKIPVIGGFADKYSG